MAEGDTRPLLLPIGLAGALAALSALPAVAASPPLAASFRGAAAVLAAGAAVVGLRALGEGRALRPRFAPVRAHWVQTGVHVALFAVWGASWGGVAEHAPHLAAQVLFYYGFDLLLAWWRRDEARTGFGPIPIVGSVNLFLWFRDDLFALQFALLAAGALAKEAIRWERDGRRTHVFNPSSFPLFLCCAVLWATGSDGLTWARDIAVTQGLVPHAWVVVFALGLVVQTLFATTLVTAGAVAALTALNLAYTGLTGVYLWVDVGIPAAIFLGCNFLVTDPATSPRTARGRALFGVLYGAAVFALYLVLRETGGPTYYDKLLCVPFLNLLVRRLDRLGGRPAAAGRGNVAWVAATVAGFVVLQGTGFLGREHHPGRSLAFWEQACHEGRWHACASWAESLDTACHEGDWPRCAEYARLFETGQHVPRDLPEAGYHWALACQEGVDAACEHVPAFLAEGGAEALAAACDAEDDALSCLVLGTLQSRDAAAWAQGARARIERACELGVPEACAFLDESRRPGALP